MSTSVTTRSTAGPGFTFEDLVAADILIRLLLDMPIPGMGVPGSKLLSQVRALGWKIDDLMVVGVDGSGKEHRLGLSCKSNAQVSGNGLPKEFVADAWEMWRDTGNFQQEYDRIALVVRGHHPGFSALWHDIKSWCDGDDALAIGRIEATEKHRRVFESVRGPGALGGASPTAEETLRLIRAIDVLPVDFQLTPSESLASAKQRCRTALASGDLDEAERLWEALADRAEKARTSNGTIILEELIEDFAERFGLKAHPSISASWSKLQAYTTDHLAGIDTSLPNGHAIPRKEESIIAGHLTSGMGCLVLGDSGVGKSAAIRRALGGFEGTTQIWLDPSVTAAALSAAELQGIGLDQELLAIFERCPGTGHIVVFDSAERLPEKSLRQLNSLLVALAKLSVEGKPKWRVIIVTQGDALEERVRTQPAIGALPIVALEELPDNAIKGALLTVPQLRWAANDAGLMRAVSNPRTLSWVVASAPTFSGAQDLASVSTIADKLWIRWTGGKLQLQGLLMRLAERDAAFERSFPVSKLDPADAAVFDARPSDAPLKLGARNHVEFEHDLASDWARYQRLKEIGHDVELWGPLASQPLWIAALRLFGQHLLLQPDQVRGGWDHAFAEATRQKNIPACDILLDALCLDHRLEEHLAARADLLFENDGALFLRLMTRFAHLATAPVQWKNPQLSSGFRMYLEAGMRRPVAGRWLPMARFLQSHQQRVTDLGASIVSKVCDLWLGGTLPELDGKPWPLRDIFGRVALENARTVQVGFLAHRIWVNRSDGDELIFKTALAAAPDLPQEICSFALEMAGRRPLNDASQIRVSGIRAARKAAEAEQTKSTRPRPVPESVFSFRKRLPPWPLGAKDRVNHAFRKAVVHDNALAHLMRLEPAVATEVLHACLINDRPMDEIGSSSISDDFGMANDNDSDPTMYWKSPLFSYFAIHPDEALTALDTLFAFAVERWEASGLDGSPAPTIKVRLDKKRTSIFSGTLDHFRWAQDSSYSHGQLNCAVDALEKWLVTEIDKGVDVTERCAQLLEKGGSVAILGALVNVGKYRPELFRSVLAPLLEVEALYRWDDRRIEYRGYGFHEFQWVLQGEEAFQMARDWWFAPHREVHLRHAARVVIANDAALAERIAAASRKWAKPRGRTERLNQRILQAELDAANYVFVEALETGQKALGLEYPEDLKAAIIEHQATTSTELRPITLPLECEQLLAQRAPLSDANAGHLASFLPGPKTAIASGGDERRLLAAAAATLAARGGAWLDENPEAKAAAHRVLRHLALEIETSHEGLRRRGLVNDPVLKFVAIGTIHAAVRTTNRSSWDEPVVALLTCRDTDAIGSLMAAAEELKSELSSAWFRLNQLLVLSAGLDRLAPGYEEQELLGPIWNRWLATFRSRHIFQVDASIASVDPIGIARRVERLLEDRRARTLSGRSPKRRGKARRWAGLSSHILKAGFGWLLDMDASPSIMESEDNRILLSRLLGFELWRLLGDNRTGEVTDADDLEDDDGEYDLPSELGYAVLHILPRMLVAAPPEIARETWRSVFAVGPLGHYVVERLISSLFMLLYKKPDTGRFMAEWRAMLDYGLDAGWRSGPSWFRGSAMLVNLLGLNSFQILEQATEIRDRLPEMKAYYERWAAAEMRKDEESVAAFAHFLTRPPGYFLQLEGIIWINEALRGTERFYRGAGNNVAEALDAILTLRGPELANEHASRNAMIEIAALLVSQQVSTGQGLQARIAAIK